MKIDSKTKFISWGLEQIKELTINGVPAPISEFVKYEDTFKFLWKIILDFYKRYPFEVYKNDISIRCITDKSIISHSVNGTICLIKIKGDIMSYYEVKGPGRIINLEKIEKKILSISVYEQPDEIL